MRLKTKDFLMVGLQMIFFVIYLFDFKFIDLNIPVFISVFGLAITFLGIGMLVLAMIQLNKNLSPFPTPKSNSELIQTGLYKFVRHPIYTGILLILSGYAVYSASIFRLSISILVYILFVIKSTYEEKLLIERFSKYLSYKEKTGRFFPKI